MTDSNFGLSQKDLIYIIETVKNFPSVYQALIFGSRATGDFKKGSDVDLALKSSNLNFDSKKSAISAHLNEDSPMPYFFDIIHYESMDNENLKKHIDQYGQVIYKK